MSDLFGFPLISLSLFLIFAIPSSIYDVLKFRIPLIYVIAGIVTFLGFYIYYFFPAYTSPVFRQAIISAAVNFVILYLIRYLTSNGLGLGDAIFGILGGLFSINIIASIASLGFAGILGLIFFLIFSFTKKKKNGGTVIISHYFVIPFIPFLSAGYMLSWLMMWIFR